MVRLFVWLALGIAGILFIGYFENGQTLENKQYLALRQFENDDSVPQQMRSEQWQRNYAYLGGMAAWLFLGLLLFSGDIARKMKKVLPLLLIGGLSLTSVGCYRPFEPIKYEVIGPNEEAFLLPYKGDTTKQTSSNSEEYLKSNLVYTKQIQIPQQWVPKGYETFGANGNWTDAAKLIKVDKSPVTREWTADPNSGTSNKNEAIWVMTSDQVEFSTGWTITARIASRDDAVKFLHNYPSGSLQQVLDTEARAKIQAVFGLEVTDLPMDELRKAATPHIVKTVKQVTEFFQERGITITNLGITGGFVYKDPKIIETMVRVFNAEQERSIAAAATAAQTERNKTIQLEATAKAQALLTEKEAEAKGIQAVADARSYEVDKIKTDPETYLMLKRLQIEESKLKVWNGAFPTFYMGAAGQLPDMLLNIPAFSSTPSK